MARHYPDDTLDSRVRNVEAPRGGIAALGRGVADAITWALPLFKSYRPYQEAEALLASDPAVASAAAQMGMDTGQVAGYLQQARAQRSGLWTYATIIDTCDKYASVAVGILEAGLTLLAAVPVIGPMVTGLGIGTTTAAEAVVGAVYKLPFITYLATQGHKDRAGELLVTELASLAGPPGEVVDFLNRYVSNARRVIAAEAGDHILAAYDLRFPVIDVKPSPAAPPAGYIGTGS
jgi:hypothetical protein